MQIQQAIKIKMEIIHLNYTGLIYDFTHLHSNLDLKILNFLSVEN